MAYRATGTGRDGYIAGAGRKGGAAAHDINARRDGLPNNVFAYLKEQVEREQYESFVHEQQTAKHQAMAAAGRGGKRIVAADAGVAEEVQHFVSVKEAARRHQRLQHLYAMEMAQWEAELADRGLAIDNSRQS